MPPAAHTAAVKAGRIDYLALGPADAGETAILLHASATGAFALAALGERLSTGRRVLIPNLDGYGESRLDCVKCPPVFRHVQAVERFVRALGLDRSHLIGHSMGGLVALRLARRARIDWRSLVLIEPMALGTLNPEADAALIARDRAMIEGFRAALDRGDPAAGLALFTREVGGQDWTTLPDRARDRLLALAPQVAAEAPQVSADPLTAAEFAAIAAPTLLIEMENGWPPAKRIVDRLAAALPNAQRTLMPEGGHMAPVTHPAAISAAIEAFHAMHDTQSAGLEALLRRPQSRVQDTAIQGG